MRFFIAVWLFCVGALNCVEGAVAPFITLLNENRVTVLDIDTHLEIASISVCTNPQMVVSNEGDRVYVGNASGTISVIEASLGQVIATVTVSGAPVFLALSTNDAKLYASNNVDRTLVIDTATYQIIATVTIAGAADIVVSPLNAYVGTSTGGIVVVINQTTNNVVATVTVAAAPFNLEFASPHVFSVNRDANNVSMIDTTTNQVVATVTVGTSPRDVKVVNGRAFVSNFLTDNVSVIDTLAVTPTVIATVTVGDSPQVLAGSFLHQKIYVSNNADQTISIIDPNPPFSVLATIGPLDGNILEFTFTPDGSQLYGVMGDTFEIVIIDTSNQAITNVTVGDVPQDVAFALSPQVPTSGIQMPTFLRGRQTKNEFLGQIELVNVLTWAPPSSGATPVSYSIYRNPDLTDLAGAVSASAALQFSDHSRRKKVTYIYYVVSIDSSGSRSSPAILAVQP